MPTFRAGEQAPGWCQLQQFMVLDFEEGDRRDFSIERESERLLVTSGTVQVALPEQERSLVLKEAQFLDLPAGAKGSFLACSPRAQAVRLMGRWGADLGGCGIFRVGNVAEPTNIGDPVDYEKTTSVDVHYHDCDEYWILLEGDGTVRVGDRHLKVSAGDCVPIGMGHHHDFPTVESPVKAVFFETTLEGAKRVGHLWNHTHGIAEPKQERV